MSRYLVTGGAGFIGSHLTETLLERGHEVWVMDDLSTGKRENISDGTHLIQADVRDEDALARVLSERLDGVFHLAAVASVQRSVDDWAGTHSINQTAFIRLLDTLAKTASEVPVVYASSAAVYGNPAGVEPLAETTACQPLTPYGADKLACELAARVAGQLFRTPTYGLRFFNVYGPRQDPASPYSGVISIFRDRLKRGLPVTIFGDGEQVRDFIYVADVVAVLMAAMETCAPGAPVSNVCTGQATSVNDLVSLLARSLNMKPAVQHQPERAGDIRSSLGDTARLREHLWDTTPSRIEDHIEFD